MKKIILTAAALVLISTLAFAHRLDGSWKGAIDTDNGKMNVYLTLKVEKRKALTGSIGNDEGDVYLYNGSVKRRTFEYSFDVGEYSFEHKGKIISRDEIEITWQTDQYGEVKFTMKKSD